MANPAAIDGSVIVVTGDGVLNYNLASTPRGKGSGQDAEASGTARLSVEPGGAALLSALVSAAAADLPGLDGKPIAVRSMGSPRETLSPGDDVYHQSFGLWSQFK